MMQPPLFIDGIGGFGIGAPLVFNDETLSVMRSADHHQISAMAIAPRLFAPVPAPVSISLLEKKGFDELDNNGFRQLPCRITLEITPIQTSCKAFYSILIILVMSRSPR